MARIRTVKPEFWSDEQVMECSPLARLMFIGIWNFCDDGGNHPLSEKTIKALVFPGDDINSTTIRRMLVELSSNALVRFYESGGKAYLNVKGWRHQKIDKPTIKHPDFYEGIEVFPHDLWPADHVVVEASSNTRRILVEASPPEGEGKGKGKGIGKDQERCPNIEKPKATATRKTKIPSPFLLTVEMRSWAVESAPGVDLKTETEKFVDYWRAEAKTKADWPATWRNWIRKAQQDLNRSPGRGTGGGLVNRQQQIEDQSAAVVLEIQQRELQRQRQAAGEIVSHGDLISPAGEVIYVD
jgi:hypothetical protein